MVAVVDTDVTDGLAAMTDLSFVTVCDAAVLEADMLVETRVIGLTVDMAVGTD